ncbi:MAG: polysaccharide biosynthesis protein [archaeon]|nr:polysaccharide biosynthesis protein [archaeon]
MNNSNKTMAKNTIMLYFRMMITMVVSLYTSRVILQTLGVTDYGIYQAVGGIVGFMTFINGALATGSSRFLTFELGSGNFEKLKRTFSTTLTIHFVLAVVIAIVGETVGLWFLYNKLEIPFERFDSAIFCFHLSIVAAAISIIQVPYNATIISHEKMNIYAYVSIVEVLAKLGIVYVLKIGSFDKLKLYALLLLVINAALQLFYCIYCSKKFEEARFRFAFDKVLFKDIGKFSGWSLFAQGAIALNSQGILIVLNMFFSPVVVASRAISLQVNGVINQFVNNFRVAVNPQITKRFAQGDFDGSKNLLLESTKYSYYLIFVLSLPIFFTADKLLKLWLGVVPEYAVIFLQLIVVQNLFTIFDTSLYQALYAKGRIKENALISPTVGFIRFPLACLLFKFGFSPVSFSYVCLGSYFLLGCVIKPILLVKIANYHWRDFLRVYPNCLKISLLSLPLPIIFYVYIYDMINVEFISVIAQAFISLLSSTIVIWFCGLDRNSRNMVVGLIKKKVFKKAT